MNNNDADSLRDAAIKLKETEPKLAFDLIKLAHELRPNGPAITALYTQLKKKNNIKNILLVGNCQITSTAKIMKKKNPNLNIDTIVVHEEKVSDDALDFKIKNSDNIITQNISDNFNNLSTRNLKEKSDNLLIIHNLFYQGYHPDWCYLPLINGIRLKSPIGDYHNKTVIDGFLNNKSAQEILGMILSKEYNKVFSHVKKSSLNELRKRESFVDIKMVDFLQNMIENSGDCLFHTFNHPSKIILDEQCNRILSYLNLDNSMDTIEGECLDNLILPRNITVKSGDKIIKENKEIEWISFIEKCIVLYKRNKNYIMEYLNKAKC